MFIHHQTSPVQPRCHYHSIPSRAIHCPYPNPKVIRSHLKLTSPSCLPPTPPPSPTFPSTPPKPLPSQPTSPPTRPLTPSPLPADSKSQTAVHGPKSASEKQYPGRRGIGQTLAGIEKRNQAGLRKRRGLGRRVRCRCRCRCRSCWPAFSSSHREFLFVQWVVNPHTLLSSRRLLLRAAPRFAGVGRRLRSLLFGGAGGVGEGVFAFWRRGRRRGGAFGGLDGFPRRRRSALWRVVSVRLFFRVDIRLATEVDVVVIDR